MTDRLRLVVFDVDGTLIDSQADILASMTAAFAAIDRPCPERAVALSVIGLSLRIALHRLVPDATEPMLDTMVDAYKGAFHDIRTQGGSQTAPFYPGLRPYLDALAGREDLVLGVATGKSRRGLRALLAAHGLERHFVTTQTADDHPSKPHPAMLKAALSETGVAAVDAVMIGDTSFDIDMAKAAGMTGIAVTWGFHAVSALAHADHVVGSADALSAAVDQSLKG